MKLNRLTLLLPVAAALVFLPTGAFAKDKYRHDDCRDSRYQSQRYYGRGYDSRASYSRSYSRPTYYSRSYSAPVYYAPSRGYYDNRCSTPHRSSGLRLVFGF